MLCVSWSGGEDCSFDYYIIESRADFEYLYVDSNPIPSTEKEIRNTQGFFDPNTKNIYVYQWMFTKETLIHEWKHALCFLESQSQAELDLCDHQVHLEQREKDADRQYDKICTWCIMEKPTVNPKQVNCITNPQSKVCF